MKNWRVAMIKVNFDNIFLDSDEAFHFSMLP